MNCLNWVGGELALVGLISRRGWIGARKADLEKESSSRVLPPNSCVTLGNSLFPLALALNVKWAIGNDSC